MNNKAAI